MQGTYDFALKWTPDTLQTPVPSRTPVGDAPSIFTAVQEQLGLRLQPANASKGSTKADSACRPRCAKTFPLPSVLVYNHANGFKADGRNNMTQSQLVQALAEKCEITKKETGSLMTTLAQTAITEVKKNGVFVLPGIGRLVRSDRKARMGRNPATGAAIKIPAKKVVKFRVAKAAKEAIVPTKAKKATV
jgi:DNA-binding protein HU-beta